ncbi:MAG TPA: hypothetical protein VGI76_03650 [Solirubrobacteraceae bacterium]
MGARSREARRGIQTLMVTSEQLTDRYRDTAVLEREVPWAEPGPGAEQAARVALRAQVARLERELSGIVAGRFPHIATLPDPVACGVEDGRPERHRGGAASGVSSGPHLLTLGELERLRDSLALRIREAQGYTRQRDELERHARELLERMKTEPARYKFVRLPVADLGERGCGVWEVRPRLGLIGMLAGWWQIKLSSGCPLPKGPRALRGPASTASQPMSSAGSRSRRPTPSIVTSVRRWRSVIDPTVLVSDIGTSARNLRARFSPQRRWLVSKSATAMLSASQEQSKITSATLNSPVAILRLSSARARRTLLARSRARMY